MNQQVDFKLDIRRNIMVVADALLEIGIGLCFLIRYNSDTTLIWIGIGLIAFGIIQFIRKIKTFHLTNDELIIRRPLFPLKSAEVRFFISKIIEARFNNIKGQFGGPHLSIFTNDHNADFRIFLSNTEMDRFVSELERLQVHTVRIGM